MTTNYLGATRLTNSTPAVLPFVSQATAPVQADWQRSAVLWLRWNDAYDQVNERLFAERQDPEAVEALLVQLDALRQEAVTASRSLLNLGC